MFRRGRSGEEEPTSGGRLRRRRQTEFDHIDEGALDSQIGTWVDTNRPRLGEILLELGSVDPDDLLNALQRQQEAPDDPESRAQLGQILVQLGSINDVALAAALAHQFDVPLADLTQARPEADAVARVPEELARKHHVLPLRVDEAGRVYVATADPLDTEAIRELTTAVKSLGLQIGARGDIERLLDQAYNALSSADDVIRAFELSDDSPDAADDDSFAVDENAPVVQVVNRILTQGVRSRASDIHVEPMEDSVRVRYRVDGAMTEAIILPKRMGPAISSRLKVMAELNIVERRRPQDGQFSLRVDGRPIDVRTSVVPTVEGEKTVMRLLDKTKSLISMGDLGMIPSVEQPFLQMAKSPLGMILCTGPTGSGKTTTLYATLTEVNDPTKNVVTIEDPVEYQFRGVTQMQVSDTGMNFAEGLRGILRQDPDVVLVGEIRDEETARIAMQAALTGHLVLSSLHAIDSVAAIHRFTDMGIQPFLVASAINGVVAQRLLRRLCSNCREPVAPSSRDIQLVAEFTDGQMPETWFRPGGCNLCNDTGFRGRIGVYELLEFSDAIREAVVAKASHSEVRELAISEGMKTMQVQAFHLVTDGITTVDEVLRSVYAPGVEEKETMKELGPGKRMLPKGPGVLPEGTSGSPDDEPHDPIEMPSVDEPRRNGNGAAPDELTEAEATA
ncbi:GspE/PulE family protein [Dermatobacter hominis]|uniref:GspE/PulE family protein n=1 Tax=Dermatobacter hominis TaxID=2884263 RepID=UPI001D113F1F|nr:GspE/PulE family protein [Dermatobacter hominis]UDY38064.1 GspE/PulE family protein [Dermatobacter hominis]